MSINGVASGESTIKGRVSGSQSLSASANKTSVIKGESAYQLAVLNGFEGTEAEWLESLHGRDGKSVNVDTYYETDEGTLVMFSDGTEVLVRKGEDGKSAYEYAKEKGYDGTEEEFAEMLANAGSGGGGVIEETDPTVPSWAKEDTKPKYTASEVGAIPANTPTDQVAIFGTDYHRVKIGDGDITFTGQGNEGVYVYCENGDGTLVFYGLSGDQAVRLENIATPINNGDAANKKYVDGKVTKIGVGLGNVDNVRQYSASNPPPYPVTSVNGKTGAVTVSVPTQTSQLTNNSGFITKAVSDLENYYLKSETLTKTEINALVSAIPKFTISVVSSLPTSNISETTVYLVKSGSGGDLYTEYIYVNGAWEILGSQKVDLTGYALKEEIPTKLSELDNDSGYITKAVSDLVNYYKKSEVYSKDEIDKKGFLTEHQDISGKLDANKLPEAINEALAQAKESGEFDGEDGKSAYEYAKEGGYTGTEEEFAAKLAAEYLTSESDPTVPSWAKEASKPSYTKSEVGLGSVDNIQQYSAVNQPPYPVTSVNGKKGAVVLTMENLGLQSEEWTFTLEDGSTVTKNIITSTGNSVPT